MADIFLSFSRHDKRTAEALERYLENADFTVWSSDDDLLPGEDFRRTIVEQLHKATAVIAIWSPAAINSEWLRHEANIAFDLGKLVSAYTSELRPEEIPIPFRSAPLIPASDQARIERAILNMVARPLEEAFIPGFNEGDPHIRFERPIKYQENMRIAALWCGAGGVIALIGIATWLCGIWHAFYPVELGGAAALALGTVIATLALVEGEEIERSQHANRLHRF